MDLATELPTSSIVESANADEPFNLGQDGDLVIPERLFSDWLEMIMLAVILLLGVPLNVMTLSRLLNSLRKGKSSAKTKQDATRTSFILLKIHLTVIDLIVILLCCPSHIGWLWTYVWYGGEFLCAAVQFSWDFCFHLMSFAVVGIAIDRVRTVYRLMHINDQKSSANQLKFVKRLIFCCYAGAAIFSIPQWFVWTTVDMKTWSQCTTKWHKKRAEEYLQNQEFTESYEEERIYTIFHLLSLFWLPFLLLFVAYLYIVIFLFCYSIRPYTLAHDTNLLRSEAGDSNENLQLWPNQCSGTPPLTFGGNGSIRSGLASGLVPAWRLEMRSKMFRTTVYVIAAYLLCWMPYNLIALATFFSSQLQMAVSMHLELLRVCVLVNTLINPLIYGVRD